ncbi:uncharacterized protein LOC119985523 [Tripterygium wilfordii]|uniref:uncharacterized protein LOC119985523 n=1 Tax=Tripterygium wilfordii TaxID=458696 RepID=UPI0018F85058|nr:uncharacterized protein LOC119985523 [Tripterygium wilfordii]
MQRGYRNSDFWKEKFLSGLPILFYERIRNQLMTQYKGVIPYNMLTWGELSNQVMREGIALCNELKLQKQLKKEKQMGKNALGDFCRQSRQKQFVPRQVPFRRRKQGRRNASRNEDKKLVTCYRCGRLRHYANKCRVKKAIDALELDEGMKKSLELALLNNREEKKRIMELANESEISEESENLESEDEDIEDCYCGLNVITREDNLVLDLIDQIQDPNMRKRFWEKLLQSKERGLASKIEEKVTTIPYDVTQIINRIKEKSVSRKTSTEDLQQEVKLLKQ